MLAYVIETRDRGRGRGLLDCADDPGEAFVEAEVTTNGASVEMMDDDDVRLLAGDKAHDMPTFLALVPELPNMVLPTPVLHVQATHIPAASHSSLSAPLHGRRPTARPCIAVHGSLLGVHCPRG